MKKAPALFNKKGILLAPSLEVVSLALNAAKINEDRNRMRNALYHYNIACSLTGEESIKEKIEQLSGSIEKPQGRDR